MRLPTVVAREIVARVLTGEDYRPLIVELIDTEFLNHVIEFFKRVAEAKIEGEKITEDWYSKHMLSPHLPKDQIANNAGLNIKTIGNIRHTTQKQVVIEEALKHYERLREIIDELIQGESSFGVEITLSFRGGKRLVGCGGELDCYQRSCCSTCRDTRGSVEHSRQAGGGSSNEDIMRPLSSACATSGRDPIA